MHAILNLTHPPYLWLDEYFPGVCPYMIPFLSKPLIEFYIDFCCLSKVTEILIIQENFNDELLDFLSDGSKWGVNITSGIAGQTSRLKEILIRNSKFPTNSPFLFFDGFFFPLYDKNKSLVDFFPHPLPLSRISLQNSPLPVKLPVFEEIQLDSILRFFNFNMLLLSKFTDQLLMKGYKAEPGVFMGMNNVATRLSRLVPPFISGDDVQVNDQAQLGPAAIVGDTCIIDSRSTISNSIVLDKTYVGADLILHKKIIYRNSIIDPIGGFMVSFTDSSFSSKLEGNLVSQWARQCVTSIFAAVFIFCITPFLLLYLLIGTPRKKMISYKMASGRLSPRPIPLYEKDDTNKNTWFFKLSLDKFHPLRHAMLGRINLIGDTLWDVETQTNLLEEYRDYRPGALTYSDSIGDVKFNPTDSIVNDLFYRHNRTLKSDILLVLRAFLGKILRGTKGNGV